MNLLAPTEIPRVPASALSALAVLLLVALALSPATAEAAGRKGLTRGSLVQMVGKGGCVTDRSTPKQGCATARALKGPGPFMGSQAIALSPNGKHV